MTGWTVNKKTGVISSIVNVISVASFAVSMLVGIDFCSYLFSIFIAFSFVTMMCCYGFYADGSRKIPGICAAVFSAIYAAIIFIVYFSQLTTVRYSELSEQAAMLLDFKRFGLMFNYDLLGYAIMGLSTFFAGLTVIPDSKADKWTKYLLMVHGVFFFSCLIVPLLGLFNPKADGSYSLIGVILLEFWCVYFIPTGILSALHFSRKEN